MAKRTKESSTAVVDNPDGIEEVDEFDTAGASDVFGDAAPVRKAKHFWPSAKRLVGLLAPEKLGMSIVLLFVAAGVVLAVIAPKILGKAMDVIFAGAIGGNMPANVPVDQVIAQLRDSGQNDLAEMFSKMDLVPGVGIDFELLSRYILIVLAMYFVSSLFMWVQGWVLNRLVMKVVYGLRRDVETKLNRLPLNYFDTRQRGDLLSRVTNDVDNIQNALQQAISQLVQSLLTV
ncbi:ABC transporter transmembrane domain-containing protein, partial [Solibacillus isronensis]